MRALETLVAADGYEVLLFPLEYLYMSQDEGGDYSHAGTLAMDFLGWSASGRVYHCNYYAPCSCTCIASTESANRIWQSDNQVHLADGTLSVVTWVVAHDNLPPAVGTHLHQGDRMGATGTAGQATGDHLHLNIARGAYANWERVPPNNNWQLKNSIHIYDACYVNDTTIVQGYGHNWVTYTGPTPTPTGESKDRGFPWVIYARKFRRGRIS
ncbi:MAG: hypothetical protein U0L18_05350 [Acutalibacteraceae bacterium]|nr:hypothetical protein [Acutalibacteraceae bacterium]